MNISEPTQGYADTSRHPSTERLRAYVLGKEDDDSSAEIEQHLSGCDFCRDLLQPQDEDSLVLLLRGVGGTRVSAEWPALPAAPWRQRRLPGYELLEVLGEGGMGVVWKARQQGLNRLVAIKLLRSAGTASQESLARFRREAESVARLHHSHIVQIYDIGEHDGEPYLALEYVDGGSLDEQLSAGPLPPKQAAALAETLARAMRHAHEQGVVHRDLKPANVLLAADGSAQDQRFWPGQATRSGDGGHTRTGAILGTPSYMAPEQAEGRLTAIGPATDIVGGGRDGDILFQSVKGGGPGYCGNRGLLCFQGLCRC